MTTINPFDLLGGDDSEDPSLLIAAQQLKIEPKKSQAPSAKPTPSVGKAAAQPKLPSKPLPPAQAVVRESKSEPSRAGRGIGREYGHGRGAGGGSHRDSTNTENAYGNREVSTVRGVAIGTDGEKISGRREGYGGPRGGHRGGFNNGEVGEGERGRLRRPFERHSGAGRENDMKREGAGRGNWGIPNDELASVTEEVIYEDEKSLKAEKPEEEKVATDGGKEAATKEVQEKESEEKEMTLEEYEKVLEEKRKALQSLKTEERKVDVKEFESMQPLANKKNNDDIFINLGSDKVKKKEIAEKEEKAKKSVSINEFLKPAEGERSYNGGRRRGRGGSRGGYGGGGGSETSNINYKAAPSIEDPGQFPTLGGK